MSVEQKKKVQEASSTERFKIFNQIKICLYFNSCEMEIFSGQFQLLDKVHSSNSWNFISAILHYFTYYWLSEAKFLGNLFSKILPQQSIAWYVCTDR